MKRIIPIATLSFTLALLGCMEIQAQSLRGFPLRDLTEGTLLSEQTPPAPTNLTTPLPYRPDNVGNLIGTWRDLGTTGNRIRVTNTDNDNSLVQVIGFPFKYRGVNFTQFVLNTNGFIKLGSQPPSVTNLYFTNIQGYSGGALYSTNAADSNLICVFNHDLVPANGLTPDFRVLTSGTSPNRVCTIQWKNMRDKPDPTGAVGNQWENIAFQIKLYETTNFIEFVYGPFTASTNAPIFRSAGVGLRGATPAQTVMGSKFSGADWSATRFFAGQNTGSRNEHNFRNAFPPDSGRTYRFTTPLAKNVGIRDIQGLPNDGCSLPNDLSLAVVVVNSGMENQFNIPVGLKYDNVVLNQTIARLDSNHADTLFFDNIDFSAVGPHLVKAYTGLAGDQLLFNDTLKADTVFNIAPQVVNGDTNSFETDADLNGITAWNLNGDDFVWAINTDANNTRSGLRSLVLRRNNTGAASDDWLMTSCFDLQQDTVYRLSFSYRVYGNNVTQNLDALILDWQDPGATSTNIFSGVNLPASLTYVDTSVVFTVNASGTKYVAFWNYSQPANVAFLLDDVSLMKDTLAIANRAKLARQVQLLPNPARDRITLRGRNLPQGAFYAVSAEGKRILLPELSRQASERSFRTSHLAPGLYTMVGPGGVQFGRFAVSTE